MQRCRPRDETDAGSPKQRSRFGFRVHGRSLGSADVPSSRDAHYPPQQVASRVFNVDEWGDPLAAFEQSPVSAPMNLKGH